jgi:hypothetical protein
MTNRHSKRARAECAQVCWRSQRYRCCWSVNSPAIAVRSSPTRSGPTSARCTVLWEAPLPRCLRRGGPECETWRIRCSTGMPWPGGPRRPLGKAQRRGAERVRATLRQPVRGRLPVEDPPCRGGQVRVSRRHGAGRRSRGPHTRRHQERHGDPGELPGAAGTGGALARLRPRRGANQPGPQLSVAVRLYHPPHVVRATPRSDEGPRGQAHRLRGGTRRRRSRRRRRVSASRVAASSAAISGIVFSPWPSGIATRPVCCPPPAPVTRMYLCGFGP